MLKIIKMTLIMLSYINVVDIYFTWSTGLKKNIIEMYLVWSCILLELQAFNGIILRVFKMTVYQNITQIHFQLLFLKLMDLLLTVGDLDGCQV
jgi:hypothetical protein